jgi:methionine-rich copper-binding protein CopC
MRSARPFLRPLVAAAAVAGTLLLVAAPAASAHDALVSTSPASGAALTSSPSTIALTFEEPPTTQGMAMSLTAPDGAVTTLVPVLAGDVVSAPVSATLAPGAYRVAWRVVADDGHPVTGTFAFTLAAATGSTSATPSTSVSTVAVATDGASSSSALPWLVGGLVVLVAVGGAALVVRRRQA